MLAAAAACSIQARATTFTWTGATNDLWSTSGTNANWNAAAGSVSWTQGGDALFDGTPVVAPRLSGGRITFNTITVQNSGSAVAINKVAGNDADFLDAVGDARISVGAGTTLTVPLVSGSVGLTKVGPGTLTFSRSPTWTGGTWIEEGTLTLPGISVANGRGPFEMLTASGTANATLGMGANNLNTTFSANVTVAAGSSGAATVTSSRSTGGPWTHTYSGTYTLNGNLTLSNVSSSLFIDVTGLIQGAGGLTLSGGGTITGILLNGANTYAGNTLIAASSGLAVTVGSTAAFGASGIVTISSGGVDNRVSLQAPAGGVTVPQPIDVLNNSLAVAGGNDMLLQGSISGTKGITMNGTGTLTLGGSNTYAGIATVNSGILRFGVADALPSGVGRTVSVAAAGTVVADFGLDQMVLGRITTSSGGAIALGDDSAASLDFSSAGAGLTAASLGAVGSEPKVYTGDLVPNGTAYRLGGGGGTLDFQGLLTGSRTLTVGGNLAGPGGAVILSNAANDFTGKTTVQKGTLEITSLGSVAGETSALGAPATIAAGTIDLGSGTHAGTLRYTGTGHTSDRLLNLAGTTGGGTLDASGSGPLVLTGANTATGVGVKTFTLTGTSTAGNSIGPIGGAGVSVAKTGPGLWRLTGASSFDGRLTVLDGTIVAAVNAAQTGNGVFGSGTDVDQRPLIGDATDGATGQAAVLLEAGVLIDRGLVIAPLGSEATQEVILGMASTSGTAEFGGGGSIRLGRDLTLQAAPGGTVRFGNVWEDAAGGADPAVAFNVGSAGNEGTVVFGSFVPDSITAVNVRRGTLRLAGGNETIGFATPVTLGEAGGGGELDLNGITQPLASLSFAGVGSEVFGPGTLRLFNDGSAAAVSVAGTGHTLATALALDDAAAFTVFAGGRLGISGVIADGLVAGQSLTKAGLGILELSGANTFTGPTSVTAGGLLVTGSGSSGAGLVSVAANAWIGGTGSLGGGLTLASGARLVFDPDGWLNVGGLVALDDEFGVSSLVDAAGQGINWNSIADGTYTLLGTSSTVGNIRNFGAANSADIGGGRSAYFQNGSLQLVVVPEPGTLGLAALGLAAAAWAARRRRA